MHVVSPSETPDSPKIEKKKIRVGLCSNLLTPLPVQSNMSFVPMRQSIAGAQAQQAYPQAVNGRLLEVLPDGWRKVDPSLSTTLIIFTSLYIV